MSLCRCPRPRRQNALEATSGGKQTLDDAVRAHRGLTYKEAGAAAAGSKMALDVFVIPDANCADVDLSTPLHMAA